MRALLFLALALLSVPSFAAVEVANQPPTGGGFGGSETTFGAPVTYTTETLTYAATVNLDAATKPTKTVALTGDVTFTTSNLAAGRNFALIITNAASTRALTFPSWIWMSPTPSVIHAGEEIDCNLYALSTTDASVRASCSGPVNLDNALGTAPVAHGGTSSGAALSGLSVMVSNGSAIVQGPTGAILIGLSVKTSGTTYTTTASTHAAYVVVCGGGGGGGGTTTAGASAAAGGGGGGGGCTGKLYTTLLPSTGYTYAIGAAGSAGSSSGGNGGDGGDSTFTDGVTLITGRKGLGGKGMAATTTILGADEGAGSAVGTNGDWNGAGQPGQDGFALTGLIGEAGSGGSCAFGGGGSGTGTPGAGAVGVGNCSGGAGGLVENNSAAVAGGAGTAGIMLVWEYE